MPAKSDKLKTFFDEVAFDRNCYTVKKRNDDLLVTRDCVNQLLQIFPEAIIIDAYNHDGYHIIEVIV